MLPEAPLLPKKAGRKWNRMGVEKTGASSCSTHSLLGDTSSRAEGCGTDLWSHQGSSLRRFQAGAGGSKDLAGSVGGFLLNRGGARSRASACCALPGSDEPSQLRDRAGTPAGQAIWINFHCFGPPGHRDTEAEDLFAPKQRVQLGPCPGFPAILPSPSSGDLNANKAEALGAWRSPTDGRPLSAQFPSAGRAAGGEGGRGCVHPSTRPPNTLPAFSRFLTPGPGRTPQRAPRLCRHYSSQGGGNGQPRGWRCVEGCGSRRRAPHPCPPRAAGRGRRPSSCRASAPGGDWAARLWSLTFQDSPPPQRSGRAAGGRGREIRSHNIGLRPSPPQTYRRGWGSRGQFGGLEKIAGADRTVRGTPRTLSPVPRPASPCLRTLGLRAPLAPLPSPREAARGRRREALGRTAVLAAAPPCAPRPCPSRV